MNLDLELYRNFYEVVKYKSFSKAAENMYVSQSAITQSIQKLEKMLGGKVFYRNKTGVELTEEGKKLYEYIKGSIETMSNAENIFSAYTSLEKGKIRIGGGNSLISLLLLEPLTTFTQKYPKIEFSIGSGITDVLMQKLSNGELDLVALNLPYTTKGYANIDIIPLKKSNFCFFASNEYIKKNHIKKFDDIINNVIIVPKSTSIKSKILHSYCKKYKIKINEKYEVSSSFLMKKMVLNDIGIGFANTENLKDIRDSIKIIKKVETNDTEEGIATLNKTMLNKATLEFVNEIKKYYKLI